VIAVIVSDCSDEAATALQLSNRGVVQSDLVWFILFEWFIIMSTGLFQTMM